MHRGDVSSREGEAGRGQLRVQKGVCLWREDARRCEAHWKPQTCTFSWFPMSLRAASMRAEKGWSAATPSATKKVVGVTLSSCTSRRCLWCAGGANGRYTRHVARVPVLACTSPHVYIPALGSIPYRTCGMVLMVLPRAGMYTLTAQVQYKCSTRPNPPSNRPAPSG